MSWNIHCPACKGVTQHSNSLFTLKHADTCGVCSTVFDAGFDTSIEVSWEKGWASESFITSLKGLKSGYQVYKLQAPNA
jgi:hypothetical protein